MPARLHGFSPIAGRTARILVLGSMPSETSLAAGQYYAYRHNQFWRIVGEIGGFDPHASYARRKAALKSAGIALWDVVGSCVRKGSLDASIEEDAIRANDFTAFFASHPSIRSVCFNGRKAESTWRRHVLRQLSPGRVIEYRLLPSTSPAHAVMSYRAKLKIWRGALQC